MHRRTRKPDGGPVKATKDDWLRAAVKVLVSEGVNQVMVLPLAARLKVSRSSFYWYFRNRQDLLDQLLLHWMETNTRSIISHADMPSADVIDGVLHIFECWVDERLYSPRLDFAVRSWARQSAAVRRMIARADQERLDAICRLFERHGYGAEDALIRARVLYCMQVGYYVLDVKEPLETRLSHVAAYLRAFTGKEPSPAQIARFRQFTSARQSRAPRRRETAPAKHREAIGS
jgi:AcrR family transcriptional regulator